jgi:hypothetical protein
MAGRKSSWAKAMFSSSALLFGSPRKKQPYRRRLVLEALEDRCVPTTINPTSFADGVLGSGADCRSCASGLQADSGPFRPTNFFAAWLLGFTTRWRVLGRRRQRQSTGRLGPALNFGELAGNTSRAFGPGRKRAGPRTTAWRWGPLAVGRAPRHGAELTL